MFERELFFSVVDARQKLERCVEITTNRDPHSGRSGTGPHWPTSGVWWKNQWENRAQANFLQFGVSSDWVQVTRRIFLQFRRVSVIGCRSPFN